MGESPDGPGGETAVAESTMGGTRKRFWTGAAVAVILGTSAILVASNSGRATAHGVPARTVAADEPPRTQAFGAPGLSLLPVGQLDLPDPFLVATGGQYHLYLSTAFADRTHSNVPEMVGTVGHWGPVFDAMPRVASWALPSSQSGYVWDPDVVHLGGRWLLYSAPQLRRITHPTHCLGVAVSNTSTGPFVPVPGHPLVCQTSMGGDIDADLFTDPNGPRGPRHPEYLVWKSDNNNLPGSGPTTVWAAPLSNDGLSLAGTPVAIFTPDEPWEHPVLEAPQMITAHGGVWLFFSAGTGFQSNRYAMGVAKCSGPLGGCHDFSPGPLISSNYQGSGPGEETVFPAPDGSTWLLYSPWHADYPAALLRPIEAARIGWSSAGPYVANAGSFPSP